MTRQRRTKNEQKLASAIRPKLSIIIPFRDDPAMPHLMGRLEEQLQLLPHDSNFETIVVDSGSNSESSLRCSDLCASNNARYLSHGSQHEIFSIGAARDFGAVHATGEAVTFFDIDWRAPSDFWPRLLNLMAARGVSKQKRSFLVIPALYLTESGTVEFSQREDDSKYLDFLLKWQFGDTDAIHMMAPCSSIIIVDRFYYLSIGGHRSEFRGHGFEDFEVLHRLISAEGVLPRPRNYYTDKRKWDAATYDGFRAVYSTLGRPAQMAGLFVVHLWHPRPKAASFYNSGAMQGNKDIWIDLFQQFDKTKSHPDPIPSAEHHNQVTVFFGLANSAAVNCIRDARPLLGQVKFIREMDLVNENNEINEQDLESALASLGATRLLFHNPYLNEKRLQIYNWARETGFPYLVFERGAFPESWFFDAEGFNADSSAYSPVHWNKPLSGAEAEATERYIASLLSGEQVLEQQSQRIGTRSLSERLGIGGKKVLFVPLQRPSDTVIKYMAGGPDGYSRFIETVNSAAATLRRSGWVVLAKKHPLETVSPSMPNVQFVDEDTNFLDLLELSDAVAVINSGVGLYAAIASKPCYVFGSSFYGHKGLVHCVEEYSSQALLSAMGAEFYPDKNTVLRFVHYLWRRHYSYGISETETRIEKDKSMRTITKGIDFYELRIPHVASLKYERNRLASVRLTAPLFERFALDIHNWQNKSTTNPPVAITGPKPAPKTTNPVSKNLRPDTATAKSEHNRGVYLFETKRYEEAAEAFNRASAQDPTKPNHLRSAAEAYYAQGKVTDAINTLERARLLANKPERINKRIRQMRAPRLFNVFWKAYTPERL